MQRNPMTLLLCARLSMKNLDPDTVPPGIRFLFSDVVVKKIEDLPVVVQHLFSLDDELFVIAGAFASHMLGLMNQCNVVDVFTIGGTGDVWALLEKLNHISGTSMYWGPVKYYSLAVAAESSNIYANVAFEPVSPSKSKTFWKSNLAMAQEIISGATLESLQCFGIRVHNKILFVRAGGPCFLPGEEEFALNLLHGAHAESMLLCEKCTQHFWEVAEKGNIPHLAQLFSPQEKNGRMLNIQAVKEYLKAMENVTNKGKMFGCNVQTQASINKSFMIG